MSRETWKRGFVNQAISKGVDPDALYKAVRSKAEELTH